MLPTKGVLLLSSLFSSQLLFMLHHLHVHMIFSLFWISLCCTLVASLTTTVIFYILFFHFFLYLFCFSAIHKVWSWTVFNGFVKITSNYYGEGSGTSEFTASDEYSISNITVRFSSANVLVYLKTCYIARINRGDGAVWNDNIPPVCFLIFFSFSVFLLLFYFIFFYAPHFSLLCLYFCTRDVKIGDVNLVLESLIQ